MTDKQSRVLNVPMTGLLTCNCKEYLVAGACDDIFNYMRATQDAPLGDTVWVPIWRKVIMPGWPAEAFIVPVILTKADERGFRTAYVRAKRSTSKPLALISEYEGRYVLRDAILRVLHEIDESSIAGCESNLHDERFQPGDERGRIAHKYYVHFEGICQRCKEAEKGVIPNARS